MRPGGRCADRSQARTPSAERRGRVAAPAGGRENLEPSMSLRLKDKVALLTAAARGHRPRDRRSFRRRRRAGHRHRHRSRRAARGSPANGGGSTCARAKRSRRWRARSGRSTFSSIARASCITAACWNARTTIGISPSTSTSNRCIAPSARSCRACWRRAAARSSTSPRPPPRCAAFPIATSTAPRKRR